MKSDEQKLIEINNVLANTVADLNKLIVEPIVDTDNGAGLKLYDPRTHYVVPKVWSEEQSRKVARHYWDTRDFVGDVIREAIEKVFGGE